MSDDKKAQVKRAILAELNKELSKKTKTLSSARSARHVPPRTLQEDHSLLPSSSSAKLHKPKRVKSKFDAQKHVESIPTKQNAASASRVARSSSLTTAKKRVHIPQPTPRIEHPPPQSPIQPDLYETIRKYAGIWKKRTFGEDDQAFSKATQLYRTKLLQKYLSEWRSETYTKQTEWKLIVRADCHYRFYLKEKSWECWRKFLTENRNVCQKRQLADQTCSRILQRRYLSRLKQAVKIRKEVNANNVVAQSMYHRNLTSKMLNQWHFAMAERNIAHEQENIALHFWSLSLQRQCLEQWVMFKNEQILKKKMVVVVSNFYAGKLIQQSFRTWVAYRQHRKCKEIQQRKAEKLLKSKIQHKFFYQWSDHAAISAKTKRLEGEIQMIWYKAKCRRALVHWRQFCEVQNYNRELIKIAEEHARKKLLQTVLNKIRLYTEHQKQTLVNKNTADVLRRKNILSACFKKWIAEQDQVEEDKLKYRTLMARKHYQLKLLNVALQQWAAYKEYRLDRKECYSLADAHYKSTVTQHLFTNWHLYICYRKNLQVKKDTAAIHYSELLNHKYFYTWLTMYHVSQNQRQDERIAVLHRSQILLTKHFNMWKQRSVEHVDSKSRDEAAVQHYQDKILRRGLNAFVKNKHHVIDKAVFKKRAEDQFNRRQLERCTKAWSEYSRLQQVKKVKKRIADEHYNKKLASSHMKHWIIHHSIVCKAKKTIRDIESQYNKKLLSKVLARWSSQIKIQRLASDLNLRAELHHRETLSRRVLSGWLSHTEQRARDHVTKQELLADGKCMLERLRKKQALAKWKERAGAERRDREMCEAADLHYVRKLMVKVVEGFKQNEELQFKKMLLRRKHDNFSRDHMTRRMFTQWRAAYRERMIEKNQTERAMWFWLVL